MNEEDRQWIDNIMEIYDRAATLPPERAKQWEEAMAEMAQVFEGVAECARDCLAEFDRQEEAERQAEVRSVPWYRRLMRMHA